MYTKNDRPFRRLVVLLVILLLAPMARAEDKYFAIVFAYDGNPPNARSAHSFATFVKVPEGKDGKPDSSRMESHTISWLPASLNIVLLRRDPEQGKNFDLPSTLKIAKSQGADVSAWGPFQIRKELYDRALAQIKRLETGKVGFKALDRAFRPDAATNCFHAISDIVDGPLLNTGTAFGAPASEMVVQHLSPFFVEPRQPQPWVADALGLQKYGLAFRK